jgi:hypothetical protein
MFLSINGTRRRPGKAYSLLNELLKRLFLEEWMCESRQSARSLSAAPMPVTQCEHDAPVLEKKRCGRRPSRAKAECLMGRLNRLVWETTAQKAWLSGWSGQISLRSGHSSFERWAVGMIDLWRIFAVRQSQESVGDYRCF